jgi:ABC-type multidrug transport system ATPase subunit
VPRRFSRSSSRCRKVLKPWSESARLSLLGREKQRLATARLLLKAPDLLMLNEATAHLDSESGAAIQQAFEIALRGRTSIVIARGLSTILKADQILVVQDGRIVERGTHAELLDRAGSYGDLHQRQSCRRPLGCTESKLWSVMRRAPQRKEPASLGCLTPPPASSIMQKRPGDAAQRAQNAQHSPSYCDLYSCARCLRT